MTTRDYGYRTYVSPMTYPEQMLRYTDFGVATKKVVPHSEFKRPYMWPTYQEMEYFWDPPPGIDFDYPGIDFPWLEFPLPNIGEEEYPCSLVFLCETDDICWCKGETLCFVVPCFHPIISVKLEWPSRHGSYFSVTGGGNVICITAVAEPSGIPAINIYMKAYCDGRVVIGSYDSIEISECWPPDDKCCVGANYNVPEWDENVSIETIDQDDTGIIAIKEDEWETVYGLPQYIWSVVGTGFSMQLEKTTNKTNVLVASPEACGMAEITVTDRCGNVCYGSVQCVEGDWQSEPESGTKVFAESEYPFDKTECEPEIGYKWRPHYYRYYTNPWTGAKTYVTEYFKRCCCTGAGGDDCPEPYDPFWSFWQCHQTTSPYPGWTSAQFTSYINSIVSAYGFTGPVSHPCSGTQAGTGVTRLASVPNSPSYASCVSHSYTDYSSDGDAYEWRAWWVSYGKFKWAC